MRAPNNVRFSHSKPIYIESIKTTCLHITSVGCVWIKLYKKGIKIVLMNALKCQRLLQILGTEKVCDGASLLLHKRKDGGAQWIYR